MKAAHSGFLDRPIHPFNLSIGPRVERACQTMFNAISMADHFKWVRFVILCSAPLSELHTVVCQYCVDTIR